MIRAVPAFSGNVSGIEIVAHRGARTLADHSAIAPENTIPAFAEAAKRGAAIELDVIATKDGRLVVHHDDESGRMYTLPSGDRLVKRTNFDEVRQARLHVRGHEETVKTMLGPGSSYAMNPAFADTPIPALEEVLEKFPDTKFYIELKTDRPYSLDNNNMERLVSKLIREKNLYDRVTVISFNPLSLARVNLIDPKIDTGLDIEMGANSKLAAMATIGALRVFGLDAVLPEYTGVTPSLVKNVHRLGMKIVPWVYHETRDEEKQAFPKLVQMGVDGICTNAVDALQEYLKSKDDR